MLQPPDVTAIVTAHNEGLYLGPALKSCDAARRFAKDTLGIETELIVIADNPDEITLQVAEGMLSRGARVIRTAYGDPGLARNRAVQDASGKYVTFLDGDDLWSSNWIAAAWQKAEANRRLAVYHSRVNVVFGQERTLWWHIDSDGPLFDPLYMRWSNYWDALCFVARNVALEIPYKANHLALGFGHEDWHWNCLTLERGIPHKPVPETIHFKRKRPGSQMRRVDSSDGVVWPLEAEMPRRRSNACRDGADGSGTSSERP